MKQIKNLFHFIFEIIKRKNDEILCLQGCFGSKLEFMRFPDLS